MKMFKVKACDFLDIFKIKIEREYPYRMYEFNLSEKESFRIVR